MKNNNENEGVRRFGVHASKTSKQFKRDTWWRLIIYRVADDMKWTSDTVTMTMKLKWDVKPGRLDQRTDDVKLQADYKVGMTVTTGSWPSTYRSKSRHANHSATAANVRR